MVCVVSSTDALQKPSYEPLIQSSLTLARLTLSSKPPRPLRPARRGASQLLRVLQVQHRAALRAGSMLIRGRSSRLSSRGRRRDRATMEASRPPRPPRRRYLGRQGRGWTPRRGGSRSRDHRRGRGLDGAGLCQGGRGLFARAAAQGDEAQELARLRGSLGGNHRGRLRGSRARGRLQGERLRAASRERRDCCRGRSEVFRPTWHAWDDLLPRPIRPVCRQMRRGLGGHCGR